MKLVQEPDCPNLYRDLDSGVWYWRQFVTGRGEFKRSTKEKHSKIRAKTVGGKMFAKWLSDPAELRKHRWKFHEISAEVLKSKERKSPATYTSAKLQITKHLNPFFGNYFIDQVTSELWEEYIEAELEREEPRKLFNDRKHLVMVMTRAYKKGLIPKPIEFENPDADTDVGKVYSDAEIHALLKEAKGDLKLQIMCGYKMGMRKTEVLTLNWKWVDVVNGKIHLPAHITKTRSGRSFPIDYEILAILRQMQSSAKSEWVFPGRDKPETHIATNKTSWTSCRRRAGVVGRFHDLRHTFLTLAFHRFKLPPQDVCAFAGLSLKVAYDVYLHPQADDLRDINAAFSGTRAARVETNHAAIGNIQIQERTISENQTAGGNLKLIRKISEDFLIGDENV